MKGYFKLIWADNGAIIKESGYMQVIEDFDIPAETAPHTIEQRIGELFTGIEQNNGDYCDECHACDTDVIGFMVEYTMTPITKM